MTLGISQEREMTIEDRQLKVGYATDLHQIWPINSNILDCSSLESGFFNEIENTFLNIPPSLYLENLIPSIPEKHHARLSGLWKMVTETQRSLIDISSIMRTHWLSANEKWAEPEAIEVLAETPLKYQKKFAAAICAQASRTPEEQGKTAKDPEFETSIISQFQGQEITPEQRALMQTMTDHRRWKNYDRINREGFFRIQKKYMEALRIYYEMLLEKNTKKHEEKTEYVLPPKENPLRQKIAERLRWVRAIETIHQGIANSKTSHHEQESKSRIRKGDPIPFTSHEFQVGISTLYDIAPFIFGKEKMPYNFDIIILLTLCLIHDVFEDTDLGIKDISERIQRLISFDTRIDQNIRSGFGVERNEIKRRVLDLIKQTSTPLIARVIRIVSNNIQLTSQEISIAAKENIAGKEKTQEAVKASENNKKFWPTKDAKPPLSMFQDFPEEYDDYKLTSFLIRMNTIAENSWERQYALIIKNEDRAHNNSTLENLPPEHQQKQLRSTVTRLIAYQVKHHNLKRYPVYNSLERLIRITTQEYIRFETEYPQMTTDMDREYIHTLIQWYTQLKSRGLFKPPTEKMQKTQEIWHSQNAKPDHKMPTLEDYQQRVLDSQP